MNTTPQDCIDICNSLLRGELAAIETYQQAEEKFEGKPQEPQLSHLKATHAAHASRIREHILSMGGKPSESSGAWGTFAHAVEGTAKLFGQSSTLQALIEGESLGIAEYENVLNDEYVMEPIRSVYRTEFVPALRRNVEELETLQHTI